LEALPVKELLGSFGRETLTGHLGQNPMQGAKKA
jgi:hypothetical protein